MTKNISFSHQTLSEDIQWHINEVLRRNRSRGHPECFWQCLRGSRYSPWEVGTKVFVFKLLTILNWIFIKQTVFCYNLFFIQDKRSDKMLQNLNPYFAPKVLLCVSLALILISVLHGTSSFYIKVFVPQMWTNPQNT